MRVQQSPGRRVQTRQRHGVHPAERGDCYVFMAQGPIHTTRLCQCNGNVPWDKNPLLRFRFLPALALALTRSMNGPKWTVLAPNVTPGTECNPERTANPMCAICHTPKITLSHWLFFLGYVLYLELHLVLKLTFLF